MKRLSLNLLMITGVLTIILAFTFIKENGIQGKVSPAENVSQVFAINGLDTLKTVVTNGAFVFSPVKRGTYTILVKAKFPYKDTAVQNVAVIDSAMTDVGEIKLLQ